MSQERLRILQMLEEGKISTEEASRLLGAVGATNEGKEIATGKKAKWLKIKVWEGDMEKPKVNIGVPLAVARVALKLGGKFSAVLPQEARNAMEQKGIDVDELKNIDQLEEIIDELTGEGPFTLVEVDEEKERVIISIE